jgi:hypothetical protein
LRTRKSWIAGPTCRPAAPRYNARRRMKIATFSINNINKRLQTCCTGACEWPVTRPKCKQVPEWFCCERALAGPPVLLLRYIQTISASAFGCPKFWRINLRKAQSVVQSEPKQVKPASGPESDRSRCHGPLTACNGHSSPSVSASKATGNLYYMEATVNVA